MGIFDFFRKRREREEEKQRVLRIRAAKRADILVRKIQDWVYEDLEKRVRFVCIAAVTGSCSMLGNLGQGIEGAEADWRLKMAEHNSSEQSSEEAED